MSLDQTRALTSGKELRKEVLGIHELKAPWPARTESLTHVAHAARLIGARSRPALESCDIMCY